MGLAERAVGVNELDGEGGVGIAETDGHGLARADWIGRDGEGRGGCWGIDCERAREENVAGRGGEAACVDGRRERGGIVELVGCARDVYPVGRPLVRGEGVVEIIDKECVAELDAEA